MKWTSVSERLPEGDQHVLVAYKIMTGIHRGETQWHKAFWINHTRHFNILAPRGKSMRQKRITHWAVPELPE